MAAISSLREIYLNNNTLTGNFPESFAGMGLSEIDVEGNMMSGDPFPVLTGIPNLSRLRISANDFDGSLPPEIAGWDRLVEFWLAENSFSGGLPDALGELVNLQSLIFYDNQFTGPLPSALGNLRMFALLAHQNRLTGTIPPQLYNNVDLTFLRLDVNQLSGRLTGALGQLTELQDLRLANNSFTGPLPTSFFGLRKLRECSTSLRYLFACAIFSTPLNFLVFCNVQEMWYCDIISSREGYLTALGIGKSWISLTLRTITLGDSFRHRSSKFRRFASFTCISTTFEGLCPIITANRRTYETCI